jgi:thiol:disulfide interchange protein DsbA
MKRLLAMVWLIALGLPLVASAEFLEGVEYVRIPKQPVETGAKIEVREFFWYGCPHCYALEPSLEAWLKKIPKNTQFVRTPAVFNERWAVHARAYYAFESLGLIGKMHEPLFRALHQDKRPLFDVDSLAAFVVERGGDRKAFVDAYNSFGVATSVNRATQLGRAFGVQSVPTLFVDGQYMTNANIAGGYDKVPQVLNFLIQKAAAERRGKR